MYASLSKLSKELKDIALKKKNAWPTKISASFLSSLGNLL